MEKKVSQMGLRLLIAYVVNVLLGALIKQYLHPLAENLIGNNVFLIKGYSILLYILLSEITILICKKRERLVPTKHKMAIRELCAAWFASYAICSVCGFIWNTIEVIIIQKDSLQITANVFRSFSVIDMVLFTVILAPIFEEITFRKIICDNLLPFGKFTAVIVSGIGFGFYHGNFEQSFYASFVGIFFAYIYIKTGNVWYSIVLHMIINGFSIVENIMVEQGYQNFATFLSLILTCVGGFVILHTVKKEKGKTVSLQTIKEYSSEIEIALLNPGMIFYLVTMLVIMVSTYI